MTMFEPSWEKLLIVLVIALIVLGPRKLPEIARSMGQGIREFKDGVSGREAPEAAATGGALNGAPAPVRVTGDQTASHAE
ncbi:MAG: Sec-independent protein translocase subunit TatA/TatB [Gaiellales bacterium]